MDFPSYIQAVHAFEVKMVANQEVRNRDIVRLESNSASEGGQWSNDRVKRAQLPENSSVTFDQTPPTRSQKQRRTRHKRSKSYCKRKAPIRLDTSTVINLSNVTLTEDEKLLLSRGLTFCPTPRHIDWTQVKADIDFL